MATDQDPPIEVEWDPEEEPANRTNHGISFAEAATVFDDPNELTVDDPAHSFSENRYYSVGYSSERRLLVVFYTERSAKIRIISGYHVLASVNGHQFQTCIVPRMKKFFLTVDEGSKAAANVSTGDKITIAVEPLAAPGAADG